MRCARAEIVNAAAFGKDRHAIGKDPRLSIERNQTAFKQADQNRITRVAVKHTCDIGAAPVNRGVDRRLGRNRPFSRNAFAGEVHGANVFWIGQYAGESGIYKKGFGSRDPHAQVTRAGEYSFTGHDLQTFHQSPLQIFDRFGGVYPEHCRRAQHRFSVLELRLATPSTVIGLLTRGYIRVNVLLCDGLDVIDSPRVGGLTSRRESFHSSRLTPRSTQCSSLLNCLNRSRLTA